MDLSITVNLLGKNVSRYISTTCTHVFRFFFENTLILLHLNLIGNTILVCIFIKCVLIPFWFPLWIGVPGFFFNLNCIKMAYSLQVLRSVSVINYSFETEFWYIYVLYWINLLLRIFFLARDRSLKLNTSFPVLYFDEVSMYNVIEFEFSKIRDTDRPVPLY